MNLDNIAAFVQKSGLRKVTSGLLMFGSLCFLRGEKGLTPDEFKPLIQVIVVALMAGNAFEHHTKTRGLVAPKEVKPGAPAA